MNKLTASIIAGGVALGVIIPSAIGINGAMSRRAEIAEYQRVCDARGDVVVDYLRDSIKAQKAYIRMAERVLDTDGLALTQLVGPFISARDAAQDAQEEAMDAYFAGGDDNFYRTCDKSQYEVDENGDAQYDKPIEYLIDVSAPTERAIDLYAQNDLLVEKAKALQTRINQRFN